MKKMLTVFLVCLSLFVGASPAVANAAPAKAKGTHHQVEHKKKNTKKKKAVKKPGLGSACLSCVDH